MSQHKKQAKPALARIADANKQGVTDWIEKHSMTKQERELKQLLKAIYRDGATGTSRSLSKDVQTITDLLSTKD